MDTFKVLSLNIHKGFSLNNRRFILDRIRSELRSTGSNIVFLQEVIGEHEKHRESIEGWPESNQFEFLADSVWDHYAYGKNAIYQHGHHGNAILSELPFEQSKNIDVSMLSFSQRGILHGILQNQVHVLCVHFGLLERERKTQMQKLIQHINETIPPHSPIILAGDFNDWRKSAHRQIKAGCSMIEAHETLNDRVGATFPAFMPFLPMDRIYLRGFRVNQVEVKNTGQWKALSDHCPLMAEISLEPCSHD